MEISRPRRQFRSNFINFEDLMPFRSSERLFQHNPFQEMDRMMASVQKSWNSSSHLKIDQAKNLINIKYEDDRSFYESTRSLPQYISEGKLHQEIKCQILDGEIKMILPERPEIEKSENEKPKMIEIKPVIMNSEVDKAGQREDKDKGQENENKTNEAENLEVEVVNE